MADPNTTDAERAADVIETIVAPGVASIVGVTPAGQVGAVATQAGLGFVALLIRMLGPAAAIRFIEDLRGEVQRIADSIEPEMREAVLAELLRLRPDLRPPAPGDSATAAPDTLRNDSEPDDGFYDELEGPPADTESGVGGVQEPVT